MDTVSLSSFAIGILTTLVVFVLVVGSLHWHRAETFHRGAPQVMQDQGSFTDIAEQLGMSREELRNELSKGKSMAEIARERDRELHLPPHWINEEERQQFLQGMAERIGISVEALKEELSTGKRMMDIAEEHGMKPKFQDLEEREPLPR